jgi:hypothetical protein
VPPAMPGRCLTRTKLSRNGPLKSHRPMGSSSSPRNTISVPQQC